MIDDAMIERVLEADKKATGGPWKAHTNVVPQKAIIADSHTENIGEMYIILSPGGKHIHSRNAELIALYRTAAPELAREVKRLRKARLGEVRGSQADAK